MQGERMSLPKPCESKVTTTAAIEGELARHWPKRLARKMGVPIETARFWIYKRMPDARRQEIAHALLNECTRLETIIAETRKRWEGVASEATGPVDRSEASRDRPLADRVGVEVIRR
jgi:hypothetical protein